MRIKNIKISKLFITQLIIIFSSFIINGQISSVLPDVVPSSPSVSGMKKRLNFQVDKFTGLPKIYQNIYGFELDGMNFEINLSYHASGLKVTEQPSSVGLGWDILYGGTISREIRGFPDDLDGGYIADGGLNTDINRFIYIENHLSEATDADMIFYNSFKLNSLQGIIDTEPDIFSFDVLGITGKFVFEPNGGITLLNRQDILVEGNPTIGFVITDTKGNKYYFNSIGFETTDVFPSNTIIDGIGTSNSTLGEDYGYTSSWKLSKFVSFLGNEINLSYFTSEKELYTIPVESFNFKFDCGGSGVNYFNCNEITKSFSEVRTFISEKLISGITFENGSIEFDYISLGYPLGHKLTSVKVKDSNSSIVLRKNLEYNSFVNESGSSRLMLMSTQNIDGDIIIPKTKFNYYIGNFPDYNSRSIDLWGFYNGETNFSYISESDIPNSFLSFGGQYLSQMANRNPDFDSTLIGTLKSIEFPTGGKEEYTYEQNQYGYIKDTESVSSTNSNDIVSSIEEVTNVSSCSEPYGQDVTGCENTSNLIISCSNTSFLADLSLIEDSGYNVKTFIAPSSFENYFYIYANGDGAGDETNSYVRLQDSSGNIIYNYQNNNGPTYPTQTNPINPNGDPNIVTLIEGATYTIIANTDDDCRAAYISIHKIINDTQTSTSSEYVNPKIGGIRIKEINKLNSNNELQLKRTYKYNILNDTERSSGVVKTIHQSKTTLKHYFEFYTDPNTGIHHDYQYSIWSIYSIPKINFGITNGSHITYKEIEENFVDYISGKEQKIIYKYTSPFDFDSDDYQFDFTSRIDFNYRMGLLKNEFFIDDNGISIKDVNLQYRYVNTNLSTQITGIHFESDYFSDVYGIGALDPNLIKNEKYHYNKLKVSLLKRQENTMIQENISTVRNYSYENLNSSLMTKTETTSSQDNKTIITEIDYAQDLLGSQPLMQNLIDAHRIAEPIQTKSFINNINNVLSHQLTKYTLTNDNLLLPEIIQTAKRDQALEDRIVYHKYDDKGNPLEVSKKDGQSISYIWGYNKSQPIAKIVNATFSDISSYTSSLQNLANLDDDRTVDVINGSNITYQGNEGNLRAALQNLRAALPNAMVTTFTYDPLIGITSITDPKEQIQYFYYDNFNRLQYVKDKHGNILSESEYHYRPQN